MARRTEDFLRRMMGMPSRREEQRARRQQHSKQARGGASAAGRSRASEQDVVKEMQEYAEDVEFTEVRQYSSEEIINEDKSSGKTRVYKESQVSDAEYIEIK